MPKITVYMPNHNYASYIESSVESILRQTVDDWELIIIDDGSSDNSLEVLEKYRGHPKITIIEQENKGLNVTNNVAIRLSRGKYIVRVDADDIVDENFLLVLSNILDNNPGVGLVFPDYYHIDKEGKIIESVRRKKIGHEVEILDLPAHGACTMFRKDILINIGSYNEAFTCQDGYDIWIRFIQEHRPYNVNTPLFYYRQHGASLTRKEHKILDTRRAIKRNFIESNGGLGMKILGVIPVLTSSVYHQNRPFVNLAGKPLIWHTLNEAHHASCLEDIVVASEDDEVLSYVKENFPKMSVYKRKERMARYDSSTDELIKAIIEEKGRDEDLYPDAVCLLYISTPLRKAKHIDHAADTLKIFKTDSVISIQEELAPYYHHDKFGLTPVNMGDSAQLRLEKKSLYRENGAIFLYKVENILKGNSKGKAVGHITMLPEESVKINSDYEFWLAENIIKNYRIG